MGLINREVDLMKRGVRSDNLEGLRKRISTLVLQYIKKPEVNPEVSKLLEVSRAPSGSPPHGNTVQNTHLLHLDSRFLRVPLRRLTHSFARAAIASCSLQSLTCLLAATRLVDAVDALCLTVWPEPARMSAATRKCC